jgi:hypothetical protein
MTDKVDKDDAIQSVERCSIVRNALRACVSIESDLQLVESLKIETIVAKARSVAITTSKFLKYSPLFDATGDESW